MIGVYPQNYGFYANDLYGTASGQPAPVTTTPPSLDPALVPAPARAEQQPRTPIAGEPGEGKGRFTAQGIAQDPTTWLVVTIALAIVFARYAENGSVL